MKYKRIMVVALFMIMGAGLGVFQFFSEKKGDSTGVSSFFREKVTKYDFPIISDVSYVDHILNIEGGIYSLGDVTQDGVINKEDLNSIKYIIDESLSFSDSQKILADFNQDGSIDEDDILDLKEYIGETGKFTYDIDTDSLLFCVLNVDNPENCTWQKSGKYSVAGEEDYYIYIMDEMTYKITEAYYLSKEETTESLYDEPAIMNDDFITIYETEENNEALEEELVMNE